MEEIIIKQTPNYKNYLKRLRSTTNKTNGAYMLVTNDPSAIRKGRTESGRNFVMPGGGPRMEEGSYIPKTQYFVTNITVLNNPRRIIIILRDDSTQQTSSDV